MYLMLLIFFYILLTINNYQYKLLKLIFRLKNKNTLIYFLKYKPFKSKKLYESWYYIKKTI